MIRYTSAVLVGFAAFALEACGGAAVVGPSQPTPAVEPAQAAPGSVAEVVVRPSPQAAAPLAAAPPPPPSPPATTLPGGPIANSRTVVLDAAAAAADTAPAGAQLASAAVDLRVERDGSALLAIIWNGRAGSAGEVLRWSGGAWSLFSTFPAVRDPNQRTTVRWCDGDAGRYLLVSGSVVRIEPGTSVSIPLPTGLEVLALGTRGGKLAMLAHRDDMYQAAEAPVDAFVAAHLENDAWQIDARRDMPPVPGAANARSGGSADMMSAREGQAVRVAGNGEVSASFLGETGIFYWIASRGVMRSGGDYFYATDEVSMLGAVVQRGTTFERPTIGRPGLPRRAAAHHDAPEPGYGDDGSGDEREAEPELAVWGAVWSGSEPWVLLGVAGVAFVPMAARGGRWVAAQPEYRLDPERDNAMRDVQLLATSPLSIAVRSMQSLQVAAAGATGWRAVGAAVPSAEHCCVSGWSARAATLPDGSTLLASALLTAADDYGTDLRPMDQRVRLLRFADGQWTPLSALARPSMAP